MKIVVTHMRPDLDAVGAVWAIKRFLPGWEEAKIQFVPAGERIGNLKSQISNLKSPIEKIEDDEVIHVDTGLGPLDHHQTSDDSTCAAKRAWEWAFRNQPFGFAQGENSKELEAGDRLMAMICQIDHFKEVFWPDAASDRYDITVSRILDGLKLMERNDDEKVLNFGLILMDSLYHAFQNKVWAEEELAKKGIVFNTRFGKGVGVETINDDVVHIAQRSGYAIAVRKDPRKGYVRIKASPLSTINNQPIRQGLRLSSAERPQGRQSTENIDLTRAYDSFKKLDPQATWFLHVSKRMLLNGTAKNPKMRSTKLSLEEIIDVLKNI